MLYERPLLQDEERDIIYSVLLTLSAENTGFTAFRPSIYGRLKGDLLGNPIKSRVKVNNTL